MCAVLNDMPSVTASLRAHDYRLDAISWDVVPLPLLGQNDVLVQVASVSLNYRDLMILRRQLPRLPSVPFTPATDAAGTVVAVGTGVEALRVSDRVATTFQPNWLSGLPRPGAFAPAGADGSGVLADYIVRPAEHFVTLPSALTFVEAACLPCAAVTAWNAVNVEGSTAREDVVVVQGTGGVSMFAIQFAKAAGARVLVTSSSDRKLSLAAALGADGVINYARTPDWAMAVLEDTRGDGASVIIDMGGRATLKQSLEAAAVNGRIVVCGLMAGTIAELPIHLCIARHLSLRAVSGGSRESFREMLAAIEKHSIRPVINRVFGRDAIADAFDLLDGDHFGKVCINLGNG